MFWSSFLFQKIPPKSVVIRSTSPKVKNSWKHKEGPNHSKPLIPDKWRYASFLIWIWDSNLGHCWCKCNRLLTGIEIEVQAVNWPFFLCWLLSLPWYLTSTSVTNLCILTVTQVLLYLSGSLFSREFQVLSTRINNCHINNKALLFWAFPQSSFF